MTTKKCFKSIPLFKNREENDANERVAEEKYAAVLNDEIATSSNVPKLLSVARVATAETFAL